MFCACCVFPSVKFEVNGLWDLRRIHGDRLQAAKAVQEANPLTILAIGFEWFWADFHEWILRYWGCNGAVSSVLSSTLQKLPCLGLNSWVHELPSMGHETHSEIDSVRDRDDFTRYNKLHCACRGFALGRNEWYEVVGGNNRWYLLLRVPHGVRDESCWSRYWEVLQR